ncbi:uncharacterized protein LOC125939829 [Dermacentor silvarum]|uniref:uncharacterized protein LOC125939829 n=1 Tax=Dermacentor silvarum TaxID=543639 RepID=UPI0021016332|nr:uncharacterized protein LOC125939829 [Dermacentor silvarum]
MKPGKAPSWENLSLISLTSCVGKVIEHAFLNRVNAQLELTGVYPDTIIGCQAQLWTLEALLQLQYQILDDKSRNTKAILGLDLESAFDRVAHSAVRAQISHLNLGERACNCVRYFLSNGKALLVAGDVKFEEQTLESTDENVQRTIYADEITIWVNRGRDGQIESSLQQAIDVVEERLRNTALRCSPKKSELLLCRPTWKARPPNRSKREREYEARSRHTRDG